MEYIDDLQLKGLKIIQSDQGFKFGMDAVLLSDFGARAGAVGGERQGYANKHICDLGTGTGIIPILLAGKTQCQHITAVEIQPQMADMASRSVELNGLQERVTILCKDLRDLKEMNQTQDIVTANPPYMKAQAGLPNANPSVDMARHEVAGGLEDFVRTAAMLLKQGGALYMVYRPDRLTDLMYLLRKNKLEPKAIRFVVSHKGKAPNVMLIKAVCGGRPGSLAIHPELVVYNADGTYTAELLDIYNKGEGETNG